MYHQIPVPGYIYPLQIEIQSHELWKERNIRNVLEVPKQQQITCITCAPNVTGSKKYRNQRGFEPRASGTLIPRSITELSHHCQRLRALKLVSYVNVDKSLISRV